MRIILIVIFSILSAPSLAQFGQQNGYYFSTSSVQKHTVAAIPACTAGQNGVVRQVTDALTPTIGAIVAGGGAVTVFVVCNGTNWIVS